MQDAPEVAPGLEFLSELLEESHILTASAEVNDPIVGRLMDVGRAIVTDGDGQGEGVKTLAYATGMGGSEIGGFSPRSVGIHWSVGVMVSDADRKKRDF